MASRRELKKDIDYLTYEVISDCYTYMNLYHEKNDDAVIKIINETVEMRNDLIIRVNHPDGKDNPKLVKDHFKQIRVDLFKSIDGAFQNLSNLVK